MVMTLSSFEFRGQSPCRLYTVPLLKAHKIHHASHAIRKFALPNTLTHAA